MERTWKLIPETR